MDALEIAAGLVPLPTAPLFEALPAAQVEAVAAATPGLSAARDAAGNVVVRYDGPSSDQGRPLVLAAHLDHPGFAVEASEGAAVTLAFRGGLGADHARLGTPVELFRDGHRHPVGRAELRTVEHRDGRLTGAVAELVDGEAPADGFAMWALPAYELAGGHITARVCDDLLGAAAALAALVEVATAAPARASVWGLFTRAEEIGFLGALEAIRLGTVPRDAAVLSLECSKALPDAPQGDGVIVRVGDRMSTFDPSLTATLHRAATDVAAAETGFRHQRKLMDGGACEATAFCASGYRASGVALPLGCYHNAADDGSGIAAEHVAVEDYLAEVRLLTHLGCRPDLLAPVEGPPAWLVERADAARAALGAA